MSSPNVLFKGDNAFTISLDSAQIKPGSYTLNQYNDTSSPMTNFFGTVIQGAGIYRPQILLGSGSGSDAMKMYIRRYKTGSSSFTNWAEILHTNNFTTHLDGVYVNTAGGIMTGTLKFTVNTTQINFRPTDGWHTTISHQSYGNEALVFATQNAVTSFMFVNGENTPSTIAADRWINLTPGLQIKNNCVSIGYLYGSGITPTYKLYVNGNSCFKGKILSKQMIVNESTTTGGVYWGITYDDADNRAESGITAIRGSGSSIGFAVNCSYTDTEGETIMGKRCWYKNAANNYCYNGGHTLTPSALMLEGDGLLYHYQGATKVYAQNTEVVMTKRRIWRAGDAVTGAVWNDYAECREADTIEPGYVLIEKGDDTLTKSTERLSPFAGVSSDTWGFSQGETDKAKTPIAVAGRVLVYPWQDRNNYKPGDCVCAAPEGKVDIMTREEIIQYPDRIVGTVSSVPTYDKWGGGETADRDPVDVNGRIWIKVK